MRADLERDVHEFQYRQSGRRRKKKPLEFIIIGQTHVEVLIIKRTVDVPRKIATKAKCDAH